ncbi:hypothetical protein [Egicoccus sp. AB-alg6-2]|uniref:hypothetical protein n=1 Tax=Egicoccus sp. AB-alg6-2 TaxID=3242692 RepID=UPI00359E9F1D
MSPPVSRLARPIGGGRAVRGRPGRGQDGSLSLESVFVLPFLALLTLGLLGTVTVLRDVLVLHEAARVGARAAATTSDNASVETAVRAAATELDQLRLVITPFRRVSGDIVTVTARASRQLGPTTWQLRARAHARVEPVVDDAGSRHAWWQPDPRRRPGPVASWTGAPDRGAGADDIVAETGPP